MNPFAITSQLKVGALFGDGAQLLREPAQGSGEVGNQLGANHGDFAYTGVMKS
jgi:hypothetical protein